MQRTILVKPEQKRLQEILVYIRRMLGWSAETLGNKLGITKQNVSRIEKGISNLTLTEYLLLRRILEDEIRLEAEDTSMLEFALKVLVDHPDKYPKEAREEILSRIKLMTPTVLAKPEDRKAVSTTWRDILLASGTIAAVAILVKIIRKK